MAVFSLLRRAREFFCRVQRAALEVQSSVARLVQARHHACRVRPSDPSGRFSAPVLVRRSNSAEVFRAYDSEQGELVALKRAVDRESSLRVTREAELLLGLVHDKLPAVV